MTKTLPSPVLVLDTTAAIIHDLHTALTLLECIKTTSQRQQREKTQAIVQIEHGLKLCQSLHDIAAQTVNRALQSIASEIEKREISENLPNSSNLG